MYCIPGPDNSSLINTEKAVPISPENNANIKYRIPMSLAFDEKNHLSNHKDIFENLTVILFSLSLFKLNLSDIILFFLI
jgi:hypothetical protein